MRLHSGAGAGFTDIGTFTDSPLVVAVLDTLADVGDWDGSTVELVNGDDLVDNGSGSGDITLVVVTVDATVSSLGSGERAGSSESKSCRELHRERLDIGSIELHCKTTLELYETMADMGLNRIAGRRGLVTIARSGFLFILIEFSKAIVMSKAQAHNENR